MTKVTGPIGDERQIRAIVFKEGEMYVAQCLEYDIATQAPDIEALLDRLDLTIEAEFAACEEDGRLPKNSIGAAPVYYHELWENRAVSISRVDMQAPSGGAKLDVALARAA